MSLNLLQVEGKPNGIWLLYLITACELSGLVPEGLPLVVRSENPDDEDEDEDEDEDLDFDEDE